MSSASSAYVVLTTDTTPAVEVRLELADALCGKPTATTVSPSASAACDPSWIDLRPAVCATLSTARSSQGATPTTVAGTSLLPALTLNVSPSFTTWAFVTTSPRPASYTQPEP